MGNPWDPHENIRRVIRRPPGAMKSFRIASPRTTHTRPAACAEVDCAARAGGWRTPADERTDLGRAVAAQVRRLGRPVDAPLAPAIAARVRRYIETIGEDGVTIFTFPAGQECFAEHRVSLERPELFVVQGGDFRAWTDRAQRYDRPDQWVDDFATHQDRIAQIVKRG